MTHDYTYDGSFDGLLTVLLEMYERKVQPNSVQPADAVQGGLFTATVPIQTNEEKAERVWKGMLKYMDNDTRTKLYHVFLSERPDREMLICRFVQQAVTARGRVDVSENYADDTVRLVHHISQQLGREKHRMEAFVRFEKTSEELFHATIEPDFDVLPLIAPHFTKRYADQRWLIFDQRRRYGLYYDLARTDIVEFETEAPQRRTDVSATVLDEREPLFKLLWQTYFDHANIPERKNLKLHRRHIPLRYWKYLSEKQPREQRFEPIKNKRSSL
ncbi:TIGR03915 family putative DNA repair protein [Hymenobacter crusticola]|uniref:DNA metabolism protein n=1 Tax=Hymenobacter crusticola TaxID=1770526 RepID=A0A243WBN4_9BACT|nr:TIGR03915 family putative DNA repair protein [Hymenobacter crusticola]OUJ73054.1 DNA metabolism protein [Hymenobacter crusticola]